MVEQVPLHCRISSETLLCVRVPVMVTSSFHNRFSQFYFVSLHNTCHATVFHNSTVILYNTRHASSVSVLVTRLLAHPCSCFSPVCINTEL